MLVDVITVSPFRSVIVDTFSSLVSFEILFTYEWQTGLHFVLITDFISVSGYIRFTPDSDSDNRIEFD